MFWEADELAYVVAPDGKNDSGILDIGLFIPFFDSNFCGRKMAGACQRRMPAGMRCGACFGIQPAAAPHYICPWNTTNITSRFFFYCVPSDNINKATQWSVLRCGEGCRFQGINSPESHQRINDHWILLGTGNPIRNRAIWSVVAVCKVDVIDLLCSLSFVIKTKFGVHDRTSVASPLSQTDASMSVYTS